MGIKLFYVAHFGADTKLYLGYVLLLNKWYD